MSDVGPAGPMVATAEGLLMIARDNRTLWAPRKGEEFEPIDEPSNAFTRFGRGPALTKTHAYWIGLNGGLVRAPRRGRAQGEVVSPGGRSGTRVSALTTEGRDVVAFIGGAEEMPRAFVWAEGNEPLAVTEDAITASSVELVAGKPHPRVVVLEGRLGMSPVHVREVRVTKRHLNAAPDEVVWVGPGAQPLTELTTLDEADGSSTVFLAVSRDPSHFGLSHFSLPRGASRPSEPLWEMYQNGLDPAPVAAERVCGADYVFYVAPSEAAPRSPQELRAARKLPSGQFMDEEILARARAFNDISVAATTEGVVLGWTADRRTWGLFARCP